MSENMQMLNSELLVLQFTRADLVNNCLIIPDALPGEVIVISPDGQTINPIQKLVTGEGGSLMVSLDFANYNLGSKTWNVRYIKKNSVDTTINTDDDNNLILYSLIFS